MAAYRQVHDYVTCGLTAYRDRDHLVNSSMGLPLHLHYY